MNNNWNHAISLITYEKTKDKDGFDIVKESITEHIPANFMSVTRAESEHSKKLGYKADMVVEIMAINYTNEETLIDEDTQKRYAIKRVFSVTSEKLELTVTDLTKRQENGKF